MEARSMDKICGEIKMVGNLTGGDIRTMVDQYGRHVTVGSYRSASVLDALQVGHTTLLKARCPAEVYDALVPGKQACVYVFRTLLRVPLILGVRDTEGGAKTMIGHAYYRGTLLQFTSVHAFLNAIGCWIAGMIIGIVIGLGQSAVPPVLGFLGGLGATWWMAHRFWQDHREAARDGG
jgi:hypothetical protein